mmetsp:Transcript_12877/g.36205  ORF Transcript_12877/g.36205 Transcript_12877/m.36205 type:complete len:340 (-) Transcript_12877:417-1436(-)
MAHCMATFSACCTVSTAWITCDCNFMTVCGNTARNASASFLSASQSDLSVPRPMCTCAAICCRKTLSSMGGSHLWGLTERKEPALPGESSSRASSSAMDFIWRCTRLSFSLSSDTSSRFSARSLATSVLVAARLAPSPSPLAVVSAALSSSTSFCRRRFFPVIPATSSSNSLMRLSLRASSESFLSQILQVPRRVIPLVSWQSIRTLRRTDCSPAMTMATTFCSTSAAPASSASRPSAPFFSRSRICCSSPLMSCISATLTACSKSLSRGSPFSLGSRNRPAPNAGASDTSWAEIGSRSPSTSFSWRCISLAASPLTCASTTLPMWACGAGHTVTRPWC